MYTQEQAQVHTTQIGASSGKDHHDCADHVWSKMMSKTFKRDEGGWMWKDGGRHVRPDLYAELGNIKPHRSVTGALTPLKSSCHH